jgi:hypothetical protein
MNKITGPFYSPKIIEHFDPFPTPLFEIFFLKDPKQ